MPTQQTLDAEALSDKIKPLLAGVDPEIQGAVLADLVSIFFAGHHPKLREQSIELWMECMRDLIPISEDEIFPQGRPSGWEQ